MATAQLFSVAQVADLLGISSWMVRYLIRTRQLAPTRIGTRVLVRQEEIQRFVEQHTDALGSESARTVPHRPWRRAASSGRPDAE